MMTNKVTQEFVAVVNKEFKMLGIEEKYPFDANEQFKSDVIFRPKDLYFFEDVTFDGNYIDYSAETTGFDIDNSHNLNMPAFQYLMRNVLDVHLGTRYFVKYNNELYYIFIDENNQIRYKTLNFIEIEYLNSKLALCNVDWHYVKYFIADKCDNMLKHIQVIKEIVKDDEHNEENGDNFQLLMTKCINYKAKFDNLNFFMSKMKI